MPQHIAHVALLVRDYDEAIECYVHALEFVLLEDTPLGADKRWVLVAPKGGKGCALLLARATDDAQIAAIGQQAGGRVFLFLFTDDFQRDYQRYLARGVTFIRPPQTHDYGTVAVFEDLYGNRWDLLQPSAHNKGLQ